VIAHLGDWANLLVRWAHLVAGIAWIGSSFYFIWLDSKLEQPQAPRPDVEGELWMVHSGGFYQVEKRLVGPGRMPATLHWFKWEAMLTWITGMVLLVLVYYLTGGVYLLRSDETVVTVDEAAVVAVVLLAGSWVAYDGLYRSRLGRTRAAPLVALALLAVVIVQLCRALAGRAAFIHVGTMLGTLMVANVWLRILPAQQQMIDATARGEEPDFDLGRQAKVRSVHNSYLTFPVLFIMLSNHFPQTYGHPQNWLILALLVVAGAAARHAMIGRGPWTRWAVAPAGAAVLVAAVMTAPSGGQAVRGTGGQADGQTGGPAVVPVPAFAAVRAVVQQRCQTCHSRWATDDVFTVAPNGVTFDTGEEMAQWAARMRERAVVQQTMPLANQTGMTAQERALLGRWVEAGAPLR
jgi:uncharacterized membrane protein